MRKVFLTLLILASVAMTACSVSDPIPPVNEADIAKINAVEADEITVDVAPQLFKNKKGPSRIKLTLNSDIEGAEIRYTEDYSAPTAKSKKATSAIRLNYKSVGFGDTTGAFIRAAGFKDGERITEYYAFTYLSTTADIKIPILSITSNEDYLFGDDGIMVGGRLAAQAAVNGNPPGWQPGYDDSNMVRHGIEWERHINLTYFDENGALGISQDGGVRLNGGYSRSAGRTASLKFFARTLYTPSSGVFDYPFFSAGFRAAETGSPIYWEDTLYMHRWNAMNALAMMSVEGFDIPSPRHQPVVMFLNGSFNGIGLLNEDYDPDFISQHYGIGNTLDIVTLNGQTHECFTSPGWYIDNGDPIYAEEYNELLVNAQITDYKDYANYDELTKLVDIKTYIQNMSWHLYLTDTDWPANNERAWRYVGNDADPARDDYKDGRWRFFIKDIDCGFGMARKDVFSDPYEYAEAGTFIKDRQFYTPLRHNKEFMDLVHNCMCTIAQTKGSPEGFADTIAYLALTTYNEYGASAINQFAQYSSFCNKRADIVLEHTVKHAGSPLVDVTVNYTGNGKVELGWYAIESGESRKYIKDASLELELFPEYGNKVGKVEYVNCYMNDRGYVIPTGEGAVINVTFEKDNVETPDIVVNEVMFRGSDFDWIELYNTSDKAVTLDGWTIGKLASAEFGTTIPTTVIEPKSYALISCTNYSNTYGIEGLSVNISFGNQSELYLFDSYGKLVDYVALETPHSSIHLGRYPDGGEMVQLARDEATPAAANIRNEESTAFRYTGGTDSKETTYLIGTKMGTDSTFKVKLTDFIYVKDGQMYVNPKKLASFGKNNSANNTARKIESVFKNQTKVKYEDFMKQIAEFDIWFGYSREHNVLFLG